MNVNDIKEVPSTDTPLDCIFKNQQVLLYSFQPIYSENGRKHLVTPLPTSIDDYQTQDIVRHYGGCLHVELAEAFEAYQLKGHCDHFKEELADAISFLTELSLYANYRPFNAGQVMYDDKIKYRDTPNGHKLLGFDIYQALGEALDCLKNKPWKRSAITTDKAKFYSRLERVWCLMFTLLDFANMDIKLAYEYHYKKFKVNQFRIESNY